MIANFLRRGGFLLIYLLSIFLSPVLLRVIPLVSLGAELARAPESGEPRTPDEGLSMVPAYLKGLLCSVQSLHSPLRPHQVLLLWGILSEPLSLCLDALRMLFNLNHHSNPGITPIL